RRHALMQTARALVTIGHGPCPTARVLRSLPAAGARSPDRPARQGSPGPIVAAHVSGGRADEEEETPTVRALVTGGAGFIGSHLCDRLLAEGYQVLCLDNLITGNASNVAHLQGGSDFELRRHDVTRPFDAPADLVFHLASPASPPGYLRYPLQTAMTNALGTYHALELAKRHRAKFLLASTSEAYGDPLEHPQPESYWGHVNPNGVRSCYDESKRFAESITM